MKRKLNFENAHNALSKRYNVLISIIRALSLAALAACRVTPNCVYLFCVCFVVCKSLKVIGFFFVCVCAIVNAVFL